MKFTYNAYRNLLTLLKDHGYKIASYHNYTAYDKAVILRHDVDTSLEAALKFAKLESICEVGATYFFLLTSDFYNIASKKSQQMIKTIASYGHEIGLHFDEAIYDSDVDIVVAIKREARLMEDILEVPIRTVSMHRPSQKTLESDLVIPDLINSYSEDFFHKFKYVSDSRRHWREDVEQIIKGEAYERLHILTHAFWYHEHEMGLEDSIKHFVNRANKERYEYLNDNIRELSSIMPTDKIR